MVEVLRSIMNPSRTASMNYKRTTFEFDNNITNGTVSSNATDFGESDVNFVLGRDVLYGHQSVFSCASAVLQQCFEVLNSDEYKCPIIHPSGILRICKSSSKDNRKVFVDSSLRTFEPVFNYCYSGRLSLPIDLVPPVYLLSKRLEITALQVALANYLSDNLTVDTIGELCRMLSLTNPSCSNGVKDNDVLQAERHLASAVYQFVQNKADTIACSLTGQLSARLIVNVTMEQHLNGGGGSMSHSPQPDALAPLSDAVAFAVLKWAHQRLLSGERLARVGSEENVQPDDEESDGSAGAVGTGARHTSSTYNLKRSVAHPFGFVTQLNALSVADQQQRLRRTASDNLLSSDEDEDVQPDLDSRNSPLPTQDVRITVDLSEIDYQPAMNGSSKADTPTVSEPALTLPQLFGFCHPNGTPESETCLLARTSLGVGLTSIWLGKLMGHLVSLSIKRCRPISADRVPPTQSNRCRPRSGSGRSDSDDLANSEDDWSRKNSTSMDARPIVNADLPFEDLVDEEVALTMTAASASHLAKAVTVVRPPSSTSEEFLYGLRVCPTTPSLLDDDQLFPSLLEGRSGAGAGVLSINQKDYLILAGGFTRKGCLDTVELFWRTGTSETVCLPINGPRMRRLRGRLALASTSFHLPYPRSDVIYACGGSTGSVDLASVERLTSDSLGAWLASRGSMEHVDEPSILRSPHNSGGSGNGNATCAWQSVARLNQPRSSPTAVGLSGLHTGTLISDSSGSLMVAGGVAGAEALFTVEAFIPERDQWVLLPNMREGRSEASSALLVSRNLIVVAGGNVNTSRLDRSEAFVEALDPRCPEWIHVPSPNPGSGGQLRGAVLVPGPTSKDSLLLIGGFNGQETLSNVWIFDLNAWHWVPGPSLRVPRTNHCGATWPDRSSTVVFGGFNPTVCKTGFLNSMEVISSHVAREFV